MCKILFVIGEPGCGKTTAIHHLASVIDVPVEHFCVYPILYRLFLTDHTGRFLPSSYNGFTVVDTRVCEEAYTELFARLVERQQSAADTDTLLCVEMPGQDSAYLSTAHLSLFASSPTLCIDAPLTTRIQRNEQRARSGTGHYVPESVLRQRYYGDSPLLQRIANEHGTLLIVNDTTKEAFLFAVSQAVRCLLLTNTLEDAIL